MAGELIRYARENDITQLVLGHSNRSRWQEFLRGSIIHRLTRELRSVDILIIANASAEGNSPGQHSAT